MNILSLLKQRFDVALRTLVSDPGDLLEMIRPSQDPRYGDYQANCAMSLKNQLNRAPRDIAADIVAALNITDICEAPEIAGPGFINIRLKDEFLATSVNAVVGDDRLGEAPAQEPRQVIIDYSSPNVAKPMHVGHLRSTVIGDAVCRTLRFAGHEVITDNHIGDWGTQFGMIIYGYRNFVEKQAWADSPVAELARLYRLVNQLSDYHATSAKLPSLQQKPAEIRQRLEELQATSPTDDKKVRKQIGQLEKQLSAAEDAIVAAQETLQKVDQSPALKSLADAHPDIARLAREETAKLHAGDPGNQQLWEEFLPHCLQALQQVYDRLDVKFDLTLGESYYNPMLPGVVSSLRDKGLATDSEGAVCVFVEGNQAPFIVQKTDGAYTYATTDLATIQYRREQLQADEVLYVVDSRQSEHFNLLFATSRLMGFDQLSLRHVAFGTVMGPDGRPYKTRSGDTVGLESLIDEAISRARQIVNENDDRRRDGAVLSDEQRARVAEIVGVGGIKYADLHHNRDSDYVFDWDKMLATTGDTATYMQYAYARICGIFRRLQLDREQLTVDTGGILVTNPAERALVLKLLQFENAVLDMLSEYRPHVLTAWLYETADAFSRFYSECPVQDAETESLRHSRLLLCDLMARALRTGLSLLGIETTEVM
ncbi:MAG: arginine--tRNA ligase [Planctomycetaceae bacterium]|nr:arginine--tRNA ligase [Planctomycetaceae bacterium]